VSKVTDALGRSGLANDDEEEKKEDPTATMGQSFYRKQGIDFLNFQRPGTAYGAAAFQQAAANSTSTSFYSKNPAIPAAKKVEVRT